MHFFKNCRKLFILLQNGNFIVLIIGEILHNDKIIGSGNLIRNENVKSTSVLSVDHVCIVRELFCQPFTSVTPRDCTQSVYILLCTSSTTYAELLCSV